ncbi:MAG: sodium:solute symporter [Prevotella sp.]|nr:sodium:solute symporter [Prevotella sp.]
MALLLVVGRLTATSTSNDAFFVGERKSPWYMVAFGMIGASISGVTFISVPGMVLTQDMTYLQMCIGFIFGYAVVAFVLLPVYYRQRLTTIYSLLATRMGRRSHKTATFFFLLSKMTGAAVRFFLICMLLQQYFLRDYGIPFPVTVLLLVMMIWLYTHRSGIRTIVWTDVLQTFCIFLALLLIIGAVISQLDISMGEALKTVTESSYSRVFVFDDISSTQNFWKQFFSGIFIVIVMTGLDQDMMQKNLTCSTLRDAQKDMCSYSFAFIPANLLFLTLGVLLVFLSAQNGVPLPSKGDDLLPMYAATGELGTAAAALFILGMVASSFSSADSALAALTTCVCVDFFGNVHDRRLRRAAHVAVTLVFMVTVIMLWYVDSPSAITLIYTLCGYTYGPLLGLFAFALFTSRAVLDRAVPFICLLSPLACLAIDTLSQQMYGYKFGYELLMLNGAMTFAGCLIMSKKKKKMNKT